MGGIFINYRTIDSAFGAVLLDQKLVARFGAEAVFRDNRSIELATEFAPFLWAKLRQSTLMLVVIGPHWLTESAGGERLIDRPDDFVRREIAEALDRGIDVLPVLIGDTRLPAAADLPAAIRRLVGRQYHAIRARDPEPDIDQLVEKLAVRPDLAVRQDLTERPGPGAAQQSKGGITIGSLQVGRDAIVGDQTNHFHGDQTNHFGGGA